MSAEAPPAVPAGDAEGPAGMVQRRLTRGQQRAVAVSALRLGAVIMTSMLLVQPAVSGPLGGVVLVWVVLSAVAVAVAALLRGGPRGRGARGPDRGWALPGDRTEAVVAVVDTVAFAAVAVTSRTSGYAPVIVLGLVLLAQAPLTWGARGVALVAPLAVVAVLAPAGLVEGPVGRAALVLCLAAAAALGLLLRRVLARQAAAAGHVQATLSMVFHHSPTPATIACTAGVLLEVNTALVRLCGRPPERLLGQRLVDLVHPDDAGVLRAALASLVAAGAGAGAGAPPAEQVEVRLRSAGGPRWVRLLVGVVPPGPGVVAQLVVQVEDVDERRADAERLQHEATHDALTGLPNRRAVQRDLERLTAAASTGGGADGAAGTTDAVGGALVLVDLDGFKEVNDALGHQAGDDLLVVAADRLRSSLRAGEEAGRLAGDELVVIAGAVDGDEAAHDLGRRVLAGLLGPARLSAGEVELRASAGVRRIVVGRDDAAAVMRGADAALYRAKRSGGCCLEVADVGHDHRDEHVGEQVAEQVGGGTGEMAVVRAP